MTSAGRAGSNARNALHSTGPRTAPRKAASRLNALKHGLLSREALVAGEDAEALSALAEHLREALDPQGEMESLLVDRVVSAVWRLRRLSKVEAGVFTWHRLGLEVEQLRRQTQSYLGESPLATLIRETGKDIEPRILDEEKHRAAMARVRDAETRRDSEPAAWGLTIIKDAERPDCLSRLARYEATIERSLYRALHELQRLQASRTGHAVPPPVAVDVNISPAE